MLLAQRQQLAVEGLLFAVAAHDVEEPVRIAAGPLMRDVRSLALGARQHARGLELADRRADRRDSDLVARRQLLFAGYHLSRAPLVVHEAPDDLLLDLLVERLARHAT